MITSEKTCTFLAFLLLVTPLALLGQFAGGSGTLSDPYQVSTPTHLNQVRFHLDKHFIQTADIDMDVEPWNQGAGFEPIGTFVWQQPKRAFNGSYNGQGFRIRNLVIHYGNLPDHAPAGLFGCVWHDGSIMNLGLEEGSVEGNYYVGALVGYHTGTISGCYATADVQGTRHVGGLVGWNYGGEVSNSYASGSVGGTEFNVGGLIGMMSSTDKRHAVISHCYASGEITAGSFPGGLVGDGTEVYATLNTLTLAVSSFWNVESSHIAGSSGGKGLTDSQMKSVRIFQHAGWGNGAWVMQEGAPPRLHWEGYGAPLIPEPEPFQAPGSGTEADPYLIRTAEEFVSLSWHAGVLNAHVSLESDIDLDGIKLTPIGDLGGFGGVFNGNGFILQNVSIDMPGSDKVGIFGILKPGGQLNDLGVVGLLVSGRSETGGLVGYANDASISGSYVKNGKVQGHNSVGGLIGKGFWSDVRHCFSRLDVLGHTVAGGLLGASNSNAIRHCYTTGQVGLDNTLPLNQIVGGMVGIETGNGSYQANYWDKLTSGQTRASGSYYPGNTGQGRTTAEMTWPHASNTYVDWDFASVWTPDKEHHANNGYPVLHEPMVLVQGVLKDNIDNTPLPFMVVRAMVGNMIYMTKSDEKGYYKIVLPKKNPIASFPVDITVEFQYSYIREDIHFFYLASSPANSLRITVPLTLEGYNHEQNLDLDQISNLPGASWSKFNSLRAYNHINPVFYHTHEAFTFAMEYLGLGQELAGLKFELSGDEGTKYSPGKKTIYIDRRDLTRSSTNRPKNREYHEFGHHIMWMAYGDWPDGEMSRPPIELVSPDFLPVNDSYHIASRWQLLLKRDGGEKLLWDSKTDANNLLSITVPDEVHLFGSYAYHWRVRHLDDQDNWSDWYEFAISPVISRNHGGYINPSTADSYTEGFAEFMALLISKFREDPDPEPHIYASFGSMEVMHKAWSLEGKNEELAICGILWSLHNEHFGISLSVQEMWEVLKVKRSHFHAYYLAFREAFPDKLAQIDKVFEAHGFFADEYAGDEFYDQGEAYLDINMNRQRDFGEYFIDYGTPDYMAFPWMVYQQGYEIGRATNFKRPWRYSAGRHPKSYLMVSDTKHIQALPITKSDEHGSDTEPHGVRIFRVQVRFGHNETDPLLPALQDYDYLTEVRNGRIAVGLPPENLQATLTILPETMDYSASQMYITDNQEAYQKLIRSSEPYFDTHRFDLVPTGSNLDPPYMIFEDTEPAWEITDRVVTLDFIEEPGVNITLLVHPAGAGTVTGAGSYEADQEVHIKASAHEGFSFAGWTEADTQVHQESEYTFTATHDRVLTANFIDDGTDVMDSQAPNSIKIFPNPVRNTLHVRASSALLDVQIFDFSGRLLYRDKPEDMNTAISMDHLPAGLYLLKIHTSQGTYGKRFQIMK